MKKENNVLNYFLQFVFLQISIKNICFNITPRYKFLVVVKSASFSKSFLKYNLYKVVEL